jgi:LmbE family N-acetylglucosaminyl deacetylase
MSSVSVRLREKEGVEQSPPEAALGPGPWLVVVPHDDDLVLGMGLTVAAVSTDIEVHVAVATDGAMGYSYPEQQGELVRVRTLELDRATATLGIAPSRVHRLGFPDGALASHQGCRPPGDRPGLGQRLAGLMRTIRPGAVFCCAPSDYHPDHRTASSETDIAGFWASGAIWLELGPPIPMPARWNYAVYCAFDAPPDAEVRGTTALLERKLSALGCFKSQGSIEPLVSELREAGPVEYLRRATRSPYRPSEYRALFE